jgi:hypothetical protein
MSEAYLPRAVAQLQSLGVETSHGASHIPLAVMTTISKEYEDHIVFVESKALRWRSKQESSRRDATVIYFAKRSPKVPVAGGACQYPWAGWQKWRAFPKPEICRDKRVDLAAQSKTCATTLKRGLAS